MGKNSKTVESTCFLILRAIAWLHQEDAITQRERLKQERIAAREQRVEPVSEVQELNENVPDENSEPTESECENFEEDEEMGMEMSM